MFVFGVFLVRIFPHSDRTPRDTEYLSVFSLNAGKYGPDRLCTNTGTFCAVATYLFSFLFSFFFFLFVCFLFFFQKQYWNDYWQLMIDVCDRIYVKNISKWCIAWQKTEVSFKSSMYILNVSLSSNGYYRHYMPPL